MDLASYRASKRTVQLPQGEIAYSDIGEGPVAVFVHGVFMNGFLWRNVVEGVAGERRCVAIDLPGHGDSNASLDFEFSLSEHADLVVELLDELGVDRFDLIGNDTGGAICQMIAVSYTDRLRTLTLTNCDVNENFPPEEFQGSIEMARQGQLAPLIAQLASDPDAARTDVGLGQGYQDPAYITDEMVTAFLDRYRDEDVAREVERRIASVEEGGLLAIDDQMRALHVPTLVVWGTNDKFFDIKWAYWLRDNVPGVTEVVEIEGGKLFFPDERAAEFVPALLGHWAAHPGQVAQSSNEPLGLR